MIEDGTGREERKRGKAEKADIKEISE